MKGHQGSVLCLNLSEDKKLLFSSAGDAIVKVSSLSPEFAYCVSGLGRSRIKAIIRYLFNIRYWRCVCCRIQSNASNNLPRSSKHLDSGFLSLTMVNVSGSI